MTFTNHAAAGAVIALSIHNPILAFPLAFISHFVLDTLPHFGYPGNIGYAEAFRHKLIYIYFGFDIVLLVVLLWALLGANWTVWTSGLIATTPDFAWPIRYFFYERKGLAPPGGAFAKFHSQIQRYERPWGLVVEVGMSVLLISIVLRLR